MDTATLPLLRGRISLKEALSEDEDIIQKLSYPDKRALFYIYLDRRRTEIAELVARHLNVAPETIRLGETREWIHGSFNVCVPADIDSPPRPGLPRRVIARFPLPYKTGEEHFPGNVDEKLRCEAATYVWLQRNCPDVPIPRLYGFGFPGAQSFTALENERFSNRLRWYFRSLVSLLSRGDTLAPYFGHARQSLPEVGYLVIEHVAEGKMLSESWKQHHGDQDRMSNLCRDLSRIMLSLAKVPLPRIGSWTMDDQGVISLANRPLTFQLHELENRNIPTGIPRDLTYTSVDTYLSDLLASHDERMRHQPNSIHHEQDGRDQLAALTMMRALLPTFTDRRLRHGPFVMTLTDLHPSNIFVDDGWRVTRLIDLEWACARPVEMLSPPHWLSSASAGRSALGIDELIGEEGARYAAAHGDFVRAFESEERARHGSDERTRVLRACWDRGSFWYMQALDAPSALLAIFMFHIQPLFSKLANEDLDEFGRLVMPYWCRDAPAFVAAKVRQQDEYSSRLRDLFAAASAAS